MQRLLIIICFIVIATTAHSQQTLTPPKYPWHLVDIWWTSPEPIRDVQEISIDFRIVGSISDTVDLYIAPLGLFKIAATSFYGGVQTSTRGKPSKQDRKTVIIGRGGNFSRWSLDNTPISLDYAEGAEGTYFESADYEKNFVSVRRKIEWKEGAYTYSVRKIRTANSQTPHAWYGAFLKNQSTGLETYIGSLRLDTAQFALGQAMASFVEVYGTKSIIPKIKILFSEPKINGKTRASTAIKAIYPAHGFASPPRFASTILQDGTVNVSTHPTGISDNLKEEQLRR
jgi:hypothetical protein